MEWMMLWHFNMLSSSQYGYYNVCWIDSDGLMSQWCDNRCFVAFAVVVGILELYKFDSMDVLNQSSECAQIVQFSVESSETKQVK